MPLLVNEIFRSLQGESTRAGLPCSFIRLTGCNLRCRWCDTTYAYTEGREMSLEQIVAEIRKYPLDMAEITGGEPLMQPETATLCQTLLDLGMIVLLETNGSYPIDRVAAGVVRIVDIKGPSSGEDGAMDLNNFRLLSGDDEIKFVVADRNDFDHASRLIARHRLIERCAVLIAPVHGRLVYAELAEWILVSGLTVRMQLPLHKIIWGPDRRGV